ncbi:hypothetical protein [Lysinibacillus agricola]|nr:hypothetical protein [Lysinibacillus agricola]
MSYKTVAKELDIDHSMVRRWVSGKRHLFICSFLVKKIKVIDPDMV